MRRLAKILTVIAAVLAVLILAGGWTANRWLQSPEGQARVRRDLNRALGMPLQITQLDCSVWRGLRAHGVSATDSAGNRFDAVRISASHRILPLLQRRISIAKVRIEKPLFHLVEDASGSWALPALPAEPQPVAGTVPVAAPPENESAGRKPRQRTETVIGKLVMSDATVELLGRDGSPFATVIGLNATLHDASTKSCTGEFDAAGFILHQRAALQSVTGTLARGEDGLTLRVAKADIGGGHATGEFTHAAGKPGAARIALDQVNITQATAGAGAGAPRFTGVVSGEAVIAGLGGGEKEITGNGTLALTRGDCREIELLRQIGEFLQLDTLGSFTIADAKAGFTISAGRVSLSPLEISAPPLGLNLTGSAGFDGTLALAAILDAPEDFVEKRGPIAANFSPPDANHRRGVQFDVKGTLQKPKHNLAERVTGTKDRTAQKIIAVESIISAFAKKKPKPKPEPPKIEPAPVPAQP